MKRFLLLLTLTLASFSMLTVTAEAKRMGGGGSIGQQRTMSPQAAKAPAAAPAPAAPAPAAGNKWLGPLAGLAIGAGLGAMFAGGMGGLGGAMGGILMALLAAGLVMFLVSRFRKSQTQQPAMQYAGNGTSPYPPESRQQPFAGGSAAPLANSSSNIPADFPAEAFLRSAKTSFIRLQAANDRKDLNDIREYTTPEMFAEISLQLQERGDAPQKTDVLTINTQIVEVVNEGEHAIASVRMSGQLSENNGTPENFDEIWHVQKNLRDEKAVWLLSGIQQVA
ncbi:MAG: Tim44-like domain-containing protein [Proteobacteria bacterium]|nr:Tim44-like domain-containing protein [Pseudomonadota bacterium]